MDDDKVHARQEEITTKVHDLVDELTRDLSTVEDAEVRDRLSETFRFWRR